MARHSAWYLARKACSECMNCPPNKSSPQPMSDGGLLDDRGADASPARRLLGLGRLEAESGLLLQLSPKHPQPFLPPSPAQMSPFTGPSTRTPSGRQSSRPSRAEPPQLAADPHQKAARAAHVVGWDSSCHLRLRMARVPPTTAPGTAPREPSESVAQERTGPGVRLKLS